MRADTHYSIVVSGSDYEKPKYTFSQVRTHIVRSKFLDNIISYLFRKRIKILNAAGLIIS